MAWPKRYNEMTMGLTTTDLHQIRIIMREELQPLGGRVEAVENDVKELYFMVADVQSDIKLIKKQLLQPRPSL